MTHETDPTLALAERIVATFAKPASPEMTPDQGQVWRRWHAQGGVIAWAEIDAEHATRWLTSVLAAEFAERDAEITRLRSLTNRGY